MDGIGKSTLPKNILMHVRNQLDFVCFLEFEDIQKKPKWEEFEKLVAASLFRGRGKKVSTENKAPWSLLKEKRVLVLADAVESEDQILPLITPGWCGEDSRLIITTCVRGLMSQHDFIEYDVPLMSSSEAKELFKGQIRSSLLGVISDQEELVTEVIANCEGLPLALKLLGCHLCKKLEMLGSRPHKELVVQVWRDALLRMRMDYSLNGKGRNQVWHKLRVIFADLDEPEKTIFLDLASFDYYGPKKEQYDLNVLKTAWSTVRRDMETLTESAIENLRDRCFLRCNSNQFSEDTAGPVRKIYIHPALRNMGRWISTDLFKGKILQGCKELRELNEDELLKNWRRYQSCWNPLSHLWILGTGVLFRDFLVLDF
ncbi:hypothetical protein R1flu_012685 [Riccia fluitans]|uniref:NB-ARC domain-containing protein n=1 Tax=Riccia fluitans TaxID=41844 RepID=A0ABD1ZBJ7_9MARC